MKIAFAWNSFFSIAKLLNFSTRKSVWTFPKFLFIQLLTAKNSYSYKILFLQNNLLV